MFCFMLIKLLKCCDYLLFMCEINSNLDFSHIMVSHGGMGTYDQTYWQDWTDAFTNSANTVFLFLIIIPNILINVGLTWSC